MDRTIKRMELTQQQILEAYRRLPRPVRDYLVGPELGNLLKKLGGKYGLHVDVLAKLEKAATYLLIGYMSPVQFQMELASLGVPDQTADQIVQDLNEQMFKPLRDAVRNAPPEPEEEAPESTSPPIERSTPAPALAPMPIAPPQMPLNSAPASVPKPVPPPPAVFTPPTPQTAKGNEAAVPAISVPATQPLAPIAPITRPPQPSPAAPKPQILIPQPPRPTPPLPTQPWQKPSAPSPRPPLSAPPTASPSSSREQLHDVLKKYGVDPYREVPE